jgi:DMSO/TMAO reductase YedYZ molybdopterin-dependent catalytic subunit
LAGRVDDSNRHDAGAYNQELADEGYTLEVTAADGYSVSFESGRVSRDDAVLVAYRVNDAWLGEKHFPLRLVGEGLQKSEMVGQIARISLSLPDEGVEAPAPEAPMGDTALVITGAVAQEQALSLQALQDLEVVEISVEHPKKGLQSYKGVRLNDLLDQAGLDPGAARVVMLASDGYETHTSLEEVRACADCLVAFTDPEGLSMVMPGMESGLWVKDVVKIEIQ